MPLSSAPQGASTLSSREPQRRGPVLPVAIRILTEDCADPRTEEPRIVQPEPKPDASLLRADVHRELTPGAEQVALGEAELGLASGAHLQLRFHAPVVPGHDRNVHAAPAAYAAKLDIAQVAEGAQPPHRLGHRQRVDGVSGGEQQLPTHGSVARAHVELVERARGARERPAATG